LEDKRRGMGGYGWLPQEITKPKPPDLREVETLPLMYICGGVFHFVDYGVLEIFTRIRLKFLAIEREIPRLVTKSRDFVTVSI